MTLPTPTTEGEKRLCREIAALLRKTIELNEIHFDELGIKGLSSFCYQLEKVSR